MVTADAITNGRAYLEQVVNFAKHVKVDPDTGGKKTIWAARHARVPVDFWDTEVGSLVCAEMVLGNLGWNAAAWEQWAAAARGQEVKSSRATTSRDEPGDYGSLGDR